MFVLARDALSNGRQIEVGVGGSQLEQPEACLRNWSRYFAINPRLAFTASA